ncbi:unnamed protein product, partial [marine sediment metagenome]
ALFVINKNRIFWRWWWRRMKQQLLKEKRGVRSLNIMDIFIVNGSEYNDHTADRKK